MPTTRKAIIISFFCAFVFSIMCTKITPVSIHFFIPPLVMLLVNTTLSTTLWMALFSGCFVDIITYSPGLGFCALAYLLATLTLNKYTRLLAKDLFITLPVLTYIFSLLSSLYELIIGSIIDTPLPSHSITWLINHILFSPLIDAAYAVVIFSLPRHLYLRYYSRKKGYRSAG